MTSTGPILDPIIPSNCEVRDDMQSGDMAAVRGQEEIVESTEDAAVNRAEADEEVRKPKPADRPYTPTRMELYEHEVIHMPYRNWCNHCVWGGA